jgi:hypothetical protein
MPVATASSRPSGEKATCQLPVPQRVSWVTRLAFAIPMGCIGQSGVTTGGVNGAGGETGWPDTTVFPSAAAHPATAHRASA